MPTGYSSDMSEMTPTGEEHEAKLEAAQAVVDKVTSWQHGAEEETVREELDKGLAEAEVDLPSDTVDALTEQIHETGQTPDVTEHS